MYLCKFGDLSMIHIKAKGDKRLHNVVIGLLYTCHNTHVHTHVINNIFVAVFETGPHYIGLVVLELIL